MWRRTLDSWGYSPHADRHDQRDQLQLIWARDWSPVRRKGTPLVHDGILYSSNPGDNPCARCRHGRPAVGHRRKLPEDINKFHRRAHQPQHGMYGIS